MIAAIISAAIAANTIHRRLREGDVIGSAVMGIIVWLLPRDQRHAMEGSGDRKRRVSSYRFRSAEETDQIPESGSGYADFLNSRISRSSRVPHGEWLQSGPELDQEEAAQDSSISFREQTSCRNTFGLPVARLELPSENADR